MPRSAPTGTPWTTGAYTTDYVQKTVPLNYGGKGRSYDYEGHQPRQAHTAAGEDAAEPANGYLWDLAARRGITFRNFGEFVDDEGKKDPAVGYRGLKPFLEAHTDSAYPGFDLAIPDQRPRRRVDQDAGRLYPGRTDAGAADSSAAE